MPSLLIIDDHPDIIQLLDKFFKKKGYDVLIASSGEEGTEKLKDLGADVVLCDFKLPDYDGLEMIKKMKIIDPKAQIVIITGYSDVRIAVEALKMGAYEYVTKPLFPDEIFHTVQSAYEARDDDSVASSEEENRGRTRPVKTYIAGESPQAQVVEKHIDLIAKTNMSVVLIGETGTGKEYVANQIHKRSRRSEDPFVALDCGALPKEIAGSELFGHIKGAFTGALSDKKGVFEVADTGTLFLDEIGNLTYENQIKLLRVLQERQVRRIGSNKEIPVDVRIIVATNEDLKKLVKKGEFREDIYHRLNEFTINLSPLHERKDDIMLFADHFREEANKDLFKSVKKFSRKVEKAFMLYQWPGNLRELRNVVRRAVLLCETKEIDEGQLPEEITSPNYFDFLESHETSPQNGIIQDLKSVAENAEKAAIIQVLKQTGNNKSKTAEILKVDRKTLYNKMRSYNIEE
jgi:two-component system response regulator HydG